LEFCDGGGVRKKTDWFPYQNVKKCVDMSFLLDTIPALDGQTDRHTLLLK